MTYILMVVCAFLISMSFIFISIELRSKFDRSFLLIGIANLLISSFCLIDIILQPQQLTIHWTQVQHLIASFLPPFLLWHVMVLTNKVNMVQIKASFIISFIFGGLFISNIMLKPTENEISSTLLYNITFAPYTLLVMVILLVMSIKGFKTTAGLDKKVLFFYTAGLLLLYTGGILDFISIIIGYRFFLPITSCSVIGTLGFCSLISMTFAEKLSILIRDREYTFTKLKEAYRELEEVQLLKELGQSTAIINHEIRNYAAVISGYSEMLKLNNSFDVKTSTIIDKINECVIRLTAFSNDVLEFSKSKTLKNKAPLNLPLLIENCIDLNFSRHRNYFTITSSPENILISGDRGKLERVFINIFKNSLEASAQNISVRISRNESVILCIIDDDGAGCTADQLGSIFKSFYTTKKNEGGTGLGMCIVRSIIEVHSGYISAYSRNNSDTGVHGFSLHLTLPIHEVSNYNLDNKSNIIVIKEGIQDLAPVLRIFKNVLLSPHLVQNVSDIDSRAINLKEMTIIAAPCTVNQFRTRHPDSGLIYALVDGPGENFYLIDESAEKFPTLFCEEFLFNHVNKHSDS